VEVDAMVRVKVPVEVVLVEVDAMVKVKPLKETKLLETMVMDKAVVTKVVVKTLEAMEIVEVPKTIKFSIENVFDLKKTKQSSRLKKIMNK
jgi:hypothetical protein